jgi:hypothetical protein
MLLQRGEEYVLNLTFTQNIANGLTVVWDAASWRPDTTPGSGFQILSQTNAPSAADGVFVLPTPVCAPQLPHA